MDQQQDMFKKAEDAAKEERRRERHKQIAQREKWYYAELREKHVDNEHAATILRGIAEGVEAVCERMVPLIDWQSGTMDDDHPRVVGSDGPTKVTLVDDRVLQDVFVVAYLPSGVILSHWKLSDDTEDVRLGNEFIPYHRIKSIFEGDPANTDKEPTQ